MHTSTSLHSLSVLLAGLLTAPASLAATCTWLGGTGFWSTSSAWSCSAVPGPTDDVTISSGVVTMNTGTRLAIRDLTLIGGLLAGSDSLTVGGSFLWEAGTMAGSGATLVRGAATLRAATAKTVAREIILTGETVWSDGILQFQDGGLLRNRGVFFDNAVGTQSIARVGTFTTEPLVHNQGRWQIASAGTTTDVDFRNEGTLLLVANGLKVHAPAHFRNAPAAHLSGGSMLDISSAVTAVMDGYTEPGGDGVVGFFEVRGPYQMGPQHVLSIEIGTGVPSADLLQISNGSVTVAGRLRLRVLGSSVPTQPIIVLTHGGTGAVSGCYGPDDIDVVSSDGSPAPFEADVTCTTETVTVAFRAATAGEGGPLSSAATLTVTGANPFHAQTTLALTMPTTQPVIVEALDALGRRTAVLFDGLIVGEEPTTVAFEARDLPLGLYIVRARGVGIAVSQMLTLAR